MYVKYDLVFLWLAAIRRPWVSSPTFGCGERKTAMGT